ncbi:hypothetical protein N7468_001558 [Penicillium chermesinum]|uniref:NmrA-like domain-containing protein n=1 Tax=Penicillium chermesinum TaxID=63820 RepID=A0A9W9PGV3_9EURO|nr:uncharacterized protein N7468_001558 [Penicillium chermesinum]KAJ5246575.1 hypothetical protein N7468_001558 [Penicillium chermesinum]KAJ6144844.1 hypothetical protein N7470_008739 [Penicillium chermesinum]
MTSVIVFGPTGNVGSYVARTAEALGAKVFLAMRDPSKPIPGLSPEQEKNGNYERVHADLSKPDSITAAVKSSGAKRAFIYLIWGSDPRATITALKSAGIEFVTFLSSFTIAGELRDIAPSEPVPYAHAQVEIALDEIFGEENYVAIRPGGFATNIGQFKHGIAAGEVKTYGSDFPMDGITPGDMGRVSGTVLVQGSKHDQRKVYLYGPQLVTYGAAAQAVGKALGKEVKITTISAQEELDRSVKQGVPRPLAEYLVSLYEKNKNGVLYPRVNYEVGVQNVELYTGRPATSFKDWVKENKDLFSV